MGGGSNSSISQERFPAILSHEFGGTSVKNMMHWENNIRTGNFSMWNGTNYNLS